MKRHLSRNNTQQCNLSSTQIRLVRTPYKKEVGKKNAITLYSGRLCHSLLSTQDYNQYLTFPPNENV